MLNVHSKMRIYLSWAAPQVVLFLVGLQFKRQVGLNDLFADYSHVITPRGEAIHRHGHDENEHLHERHPDGKERSKKK